MGHIDIQSIIIVLLGGINFIQLFQYKTTVKKYKAEANSATVDAEQKKIDLHQDQYDYLLQKLTKYQEDYFSMSERLQEQTRKDIGIINTKCNEIAELKSKIMYYKGLRCYRSDCGKRICTNPEHNTENK